MIGERQRPISQRQEQVLGRLGTHPRSLRAVSEVCGLPTNTVSSALRALAEKGLVGRDEMVTGGLGWRRA